MDQHKPCYFLDTCALLSLENLVTYGLFYHAILLYRKLQEIIDTIVSRYQSSWWGGSTLLCMDCIGKLVYFRSIGRTGHVLGNLLLNVRVSFHLSSAPSICGQLRKQLTMLTHFHFRIDTKPIRKHCNYVFSITTLLGLVCMGQDLAF